jgi:hypothetical protein
MPNDMGVISKGRKQIRWKKVSQTMKGAKWTRAKDDVKDFHDATSLHNYNLILSVIF